MDGVNGSELSSSIPLSVYLSLSFLLSFGYRGFLVFIAELCAPAIRPSASAPFLCFLARTHSRAPWSQDPMYRPIGYGYASRIYC